MSKPYFTPDPPPGSNDVAELREWLVRQIERISDWWPQDLQSRVETLEILSPAVAGTWPIIDFSTVQFNGAFDLNFDPPLSCGTGFAFLVGDNLGYLTSLNHVDFHAATNTLLVSGSPNVSTGRGFVAVNAATGNVPFAQLNATRNGHRIVSSVGSVSDKTQLWLSRWTLGGGTRFVDVRRLTDFTLLGTFNFGSNNSAPQAENTTTVFYSGDFSAGLAIRLVNKLGLGIQSINVPTGWRTSFSASNAVAHTNILGLGEYLVPLQNIADPTKFGFSTLTGSSFSTVQQITGLSFPITQFAFSPVLVGEKIYWPINDATNLRAYIVETDLEGTPSREILAYNGASGLFDLAGLRNLEYSATTNALYYTRGNELWKYSLTSDTWSSCNPAFAPELTAFGTVRAGRGTPLCYVEGNIWCCVLRIQSSGGVETFAVEKIPVEL